MKIFLSSIFFLIQVSLVSQLADSKIIDSANCRDGENIEYCKTHKLMNKLKKDPVAYRQYLEEKLELKKIENQISNNTAIRVVYRIPLVFHVLHNDGVENISRQQIEDAVAILNRDFRRQNADANTVQSTFSGMPADIEIEFELATKAPNGQCFSGITRTLSPLTNSGANGANQVSAIILGNDVYNSTWPGNKYLNIFVVNDADGAAGYTTNPTNNTFSGINMRNGIWILHDYVGSIGTSDNYSSRTLTHEVGHWLNLEHLWGPNNNPGNNSSCSSDDYVDDTPRCIGVTSCNLNSNTCSNDVIDGYWTSDVVDNVENYMEYSSCNKMFTNGQKNRMRAAMVSSIGGRNNIWTTNNHNATGLNSTPSLCAVDIRVERDLVCGGDNIQFFDESYNNITSWNWTFPNGSPSSSTQQNPIISYSGSGSFDVTLEVTDAIGNTMTQIFPNFITVIGPANPPPIYEGFETISSIPNNDWSVYNPSGPGFEVVSTAFNTGSQSVKLDNSQGTNGSIDELISNTIDLSNSAAASISFKYAFAKRNSGNTDYFQVYASKDCGETWFMRKNISSAIISTMSNTNSSITPTGSDWKTITIGPNSFTNYLVSNFRFKFKFVNGGGNDFFIDNINLSGSVSIDEFVINEDLSIHPNPVVDNLNISFYTISELTRPVIEVFDAMGRLVSSKKLKNVVSGSNQLVMPSSNLDAGWYLLVLKSQEKIVTNKFLKK